MLKKVIKIYDDIELYAISIGLVTIVGVLFIQVVARFVFDEGLTWSEELARVLFIWVSWLGISLGQKKGEHIKVTMIVDRFTGKSQRNLLILTDLLTLTILVFFIYQGFWVSYQIYSAGVNTSALGLPRWIIYFAMPFSCTMMGLRIIHELTCRIMSKEVCAQ